jgi:hypothetical protein
LRNRGRHLRLASLRSAALLSGRVLPSQNCVTNADTPHLKSFTAANSSLLA